MQKTAKSTFRPRAKCKNRQNLRFAHGRNAENGKIYVSSTDEMQKTAKSTFRPRTKCRKRQNLRFRHGGKTENGKKYVSATAEIQKMTKSTLPPRRKHFFLIIFYFLSRSATCVGSVSWRWSDYVFSRRNA